MTQIKDLEQLAPNTAIAEMTLGVKAVYPPKTPKAPYNLVVFDVTGRPDWQFGVMLIFLTIADSGLQLFQQQPRKGLMV